VQSSAPDERIVSLQTMTESKLSLTSTMGEAHAFVAELVGYAHRNLHTMDRMTDEARDAAHSRLCKTISEKISSASDALAICMITDPATLAAARTVAVRGGEPAVSFESAEGLQAAIERIIELGEASLSVQLYMTAALCTVMTAESMLDDDRKVTTPDSQGGTEGDPLGDQGE